MKKVKCRACGKRKDQSEFYWLRNQQKYHHDCKDCVKVACSKITGRVTNQTLKQKGKK